MKSLHTWLDEYSASHRNPVNKRLHWLCVPVIVFSIWAALLAIPVGNAWLNPATGAIAFMVLYYLPLSLPLALGMAVVSVPLYALALFLHGALGSGGLLALAAVLFVLAWIGQFIGHHVEGARPSFFKDLQFLLIGPLWLLAAAFQRLGLPLEARPAHG